MLKEWGDNEILMIEHEKILKSLSDRQNHTNSKPSPERNTLEEGEQQQALHDNPKGNRMPRSKNSQNYDEAESGNVLEQQKLKKQKV